MDSSRSATAIAHSNIALVKYWGKQPRTGNFPAVPSLSLTLDRLFTRTKVEFDEHLTNDQLWLDGRQVEGAQLERARRLLDSVRQAAQLRLSAKVTSTNNFPTAAGLASSASGFAALALAATHAAGLQPTLATASALARASSASAARSLFGGWVALDKDADAATPLRPANYWDVALVIAVTEKGPKAVGSTEGMNRCSQTSAVYASWLERAPSLFEDARGALEARDIHALGQAMEASTWLMHATMLTAEPALIYLAPKSLEIIKLICARRSAQLPAYFTTDAGPHVKVLTFARHADEVSDWLRSVNGVSDVMVCRPGPDAHLDSTTTNENT
jgi:diphosphomevalonate decarboxylase